MPEQFQKVAGHGLIKKDDKYLFTHRVPSDDHAPNVWDLPGGGAEFGEMPEDAVIREVLEETGLEVRVDKPLFVYSFLSNPQRHQIQIVYECEYVGGEVKLNPEEHDEFKWADFKEMENLPKIAFLEAFINQL